MIFFIILFINIYSDFNAGRDQFIILKTLGKGLTADVFLAEHTETKLNVALKVYKPIKDFNVQERSFEIEVKVMQELKHKNIVQILAANLRGILKSPGKKDSEIMYMCLELCEGGEFFDYIADPCNYLCDNTARFYFQQLISGLKVMHDNGFAHRDLKTENIFIDSDFNLKIGDLEFAKHMDISKNFGMLKTMIGTSGYQSPELLEGNYYDGVANDIFAAGVILFIMYCGYPPFCEAKKQINGIKI